MKTMTIEGVGEVTIRKSSRAKRILLKITAEGTPAAVIPSYVPYKVAEVFISKNKQWIIDNQPETVGLVLKDGARIGRHHLLNFSPSATDAVRSRITGDSIRVTYPSSAHYLDQAVQSEAKKAAVRALKKQAEAHLPSMLYKLASQNGYSYKEVRIKSSTTRWGSCSSNRIINLSVWLMQLPDELITYVILHELTHLNNMNHSPAFWAELEAMLPDYKVRKKAMKQYRPALMQT